MRNFLVHNDETVKSMLESIGMKSVGDLFSQVPVDARMKELNLPDGLSEMETVKKVKSMAKKNNSSLISFMGGGVYNKFIPACVSDIARRWEFLTAYTPYQPEISQGTLQIMYEFQSMICKLTGMDISNATVYDGASACAEAVLMAVRVSKKEKALISSKINPEYLAVIKTYAWADDIEIELFDEVPQNTADYACVLIQTPDYFGEIAKLEVLENVECLKIVACDVSSLSILTPPGEYGADIVVGDVQSLGIPMNFGGPHAGFLACREKYMRQLPGRLAGKTLDKDGKDAYTLTIQTREQHIKREKATSNICSNQALIGLCANVYLSLTGENGFKQAGYLSAKNAHRLAEGLKAKGYKVLTENFYNEFVLEVENADEFLKKLYSVDIAGGIKLDDKKVLVASTEMNTDEEIDLYLKNC